MVVGLVGSGQEIHIGEEGGLGQWKAAIERTDSPDSWDVYVPPKKDISTKFGGLPNVAHAHVLELSTTIRFHLATQLYDFVKHLLEGGAQEAKAVSEELKRNGYNLLITHDLERAKKYVFDRYSLHPEARFGMVASARDKDLVDHGIPKGFKSPGEVGPGKYGRWYSEPKVRKEVARASRPLPPSSPPRAWN